MSLMCLTILSNCSISGEVIPNKIIVKVIGDNYNWQYHYVGSDQIFDTSDDIISLKNAYIPIGSETEFQITTNDNVYIFSIPELELMEMGMPDLINKLHFTPRKEARYDVEAGQLCGFKHESFLGEIIVLDRKGYYEWTKLKEQTL